MTTGHSLSPPGRADSPTSADPETSLAAGIPGFRPVPRTGVIYVMHRAAQLGYPGDRGEWTNLGQGSPETGPLPGAPDRRHRLALDPADHAYAPVGGLPELRQKVADFYNRWYCSGRSSQYTASNVCIAPGGRAAMARVVASMAPMNLGHFIPDYTAYEELLFTFRGFIPIPILLEPAKGYQPDAASLEEEIVGRGLSAVLCSNPSNPTGRLVRDQALDTWVATARQTRCTFIFDEFYSHYVYPQSRERTAAGFDSPEPNQPPMVSAAASVADVEEDPVVLVDGLTKNWRYPGWRISWIVGPSAVIEQVISAGSFLDGGGNRPFQTAALELLEPEHVAAETTAIQGEFSRKRRYMLDRLRSLGIEVEVEPGGAFYCWGNVAALPEPIAGGHRFFEAALRERVITVPGVFFDVNPGRRRANARYQTYVRFSFGPEQRQLERGLDALERMIRSQ